MLELKDIDSIINQIKDPATRQAVYHIVQVLLAEIDKKADE